MSEVDELFRQTIRDLDERRRTLIAEEQAGCPHLQGCNPIGIHTGSLTSIVWHKLNTGVEVGLCTNCLREFWPGDIDYVSQRRRPSGNAKSAAGVEVPLTLEQQIDVRDHGYGNQPAQDWDYDDIYLAQIKSAGVDVVGKVLDTLRKSER